MKAADEIGYPIVLKLYSETITHKTDVGGVQLNLGNAEAVAKAFDAIQHSVTEKVGAQHFQGVTVQPMIKLKDAYELIIGSSLDPQFGPVLLFGTGGQLVEVFKDRALGLPPLELHAGAAHDGADQDLQGAQRRARPQAGGSCRRSKCSWCASARWWPNSAGSRKSTSIRCWHRRTA